MQFHIYFALLVVFPDSCFIDIMKISSVVNFKIRMNTLKMISQSLSAVTKTAHPKAAFRYLQRCDTKCTASRNAYSAPTKTLRTTGQLVGAEIKWAAPPCFVSR